MLTEIVRRHGKTTVQVMLRWNNQRGVIVIPKSTHNGRIAENFNVFDFTLDEEEMKRIGHLDKDKSSFFSTHGPSTVEWFVQVVKGQER
ncbi:aldo/keto reductase [Faecalicatena contorta]|uniref:aldo/keto reductase n=1 Tax=Faecalicatena contorta TaxID=39482 RepID=UPI002ED1AB2C